MRILVTGGTGYIGSHVVAALMRGGHEVRLLVRDPERISPALSPLGIDDVARVRGDVTDVESIARAVEGCEGVVHAASMYSLDVRAAKTMERINAPGTELVLGEAARRGLDPIVYVSSTVAFLPGDGSVVGPESPVGDPPFAYARSKAAGERVARAHQERGHPVAIVYPGLVWGPCDPNLGETLQLARNVLKRRLPVLPRGGNHAVDVRDVAATVGALCERGRGPRRYVVPGRYADIPTLARELAAATGRRLPSASLPPRALLPAARAGNLLQRIVPLRLPVSAEAVYVTMCDLRLDDAAARRELGISPRPLVESVADSVRWLYEEGHIRRREAGALATSTSPPPGAEDGGRAAGPASARPIP